MYRDRFQASEAEVAQRKGSEAGRAATRNAAEFLRAKDLGTLEHGKWADLIVLGKNPLDDIRNTRSIEMVFIAGNRM